MTLKSLTELPESQRLDHWEAQFLDQIVPALVQIDHDEPKPGPDGWPYLHIRTSQGEEPFSKIAKWAAGRGIGLVINAHKMLPDYVFSYGMLWNFAERGRFVEPMPQSPPNDLNVNEETVWGPPSEAYLPRYVRSILKEFMLAQGFANPKVLVATSKDFSQTDLIFSIESLKNLPADQHSVLAEALGWFLPTHYSLVFAKEKELPPFTSL